MANYVLACIVNQSLGGTKTGIRLLLCYISEIDYKSEQEVGKGSRLAFTKRASGYSFDYH